MTIMPIYIPPVETADVFPAYFLSYAADRDKKTPWDSYQVFFVCQMFWDWDNKVNIKNERFGTN